MAVRVSGTFLGIVLWNVPMKEGSGGSQCKECQGAVMPNGSHTRKWRPTPNILTSRSAFFQLQSMTWHNFHYPLALIGDGAGLQWQRKLAIASAHFEILLKNHTCINCALNPWTSFYLLHDLVPSHGL